MKKTVDWELFPKNLSCPHHLHQIIDCFNENLDRFDSSHFQLHSNEVLGLLSNSFSSLGYDVEVSKTKEGKIQVPVLYGRNGKLEKSFDADAYSAVLKTVIEVEAGRAFTNYQFLKDLFEACVMMDVEYCVIAVRKIYRNSEDFNRIITFMDTLYSSTKFNLPLKGVLIVGY